MSDDDTECVICTEKGATENDCKRCKTCRYHRECLEKWYAQRGTVCMVCRGIVVAPSLMTIIDPTPVILAATVAASSNPTLGGPMTITQQLELVQAMFTTTVTESAHTYIRLGIMTDRDSLRRFQRVYREQYYEVAQGVDPHVMYRGTCRTYLQSLDATTTLLWEYSSYGVAVRRSEELRREEEARRAATVSARIGRFFGSTFGW